MDNFGIYPREKFDPFSVMLFKALQVVAFLFFLALIAMKPHAEDGKIEKKAEFLITMTWPDEHPDDVDLYVQDPAGKLDSGPDEPLDLRLNADPHHHEGRLVCGSVGEEKGVRALAPGDGQPLVRRRRQVIAETWRRLQTLDHLGGELVAL